MRKIKQFIRLLFMASFLCVGVIACDKTDDPDGIVTTGEIVEDADGNHYKTVQIGSQLWMAENLKTTKYNDGSAIPNVTDGAAWAALTAGACCNYGNLENNAVTYGRLYNRYAVNTGKLAPKGWRVSTDEDWTVLENYVRATYGNKIAKSLASITGWAVSDYWKGSPGDSPKENNSTGFTALSSGYRDTNGSFNEAGYEGFWWTATGEWYRSISYYRSMIYRYTANKEFGFSVRCVKN